MGDVLSLIEKAETAIDEKKAAELEEKIRKNKFDLNDLLDQITQLRKMGSIQDTLAMLPGMGKKLQGVDVDEKQFDRLQALIRSRHNQSLPQKAYRRGQRTEGRGCQQASQPAQADAEALQAVQRQRLKEKDAPYGLRPEQARNVKTDVIL